MSEAPGSSGEAGATSAQLRADIDAGRTGDKVGGFDPAAAPLGADDEAAGAPASPETIERMRAQEQAGAPSSRNANAATPELAPDARLKHGSPTLAPTVAGVAAGVAVAGLIWLFLF